MKVISGGQTGADQTGLLVAREAGLPTGGTAPKGWRTDEGPAPWLADYGLVESWSPGYRVRTLQNVRDATGTVIFGDVTSPGCTLTIHTCERYHRPWLANPAAIDLAEWIRAQQIAILNVAGNRRRTNPRIVDVVRLYLTLAFRLL